MARTKNDLKQDRRDLRKDLAERTALETDIVRDAREPGGGDALQDLQELSKLNQDIKADRKDIKQDKMGPRIPPPLGPLSAAKTGSTAVRKRK